MSASSADLERRMELLQAERARLIAELPDGWGKRYTELGEQIMALARRWTEAREREDRRDR